MNRNYHRVKFEIKTTGDRFLIDGIIVNLPFSAATQTKNTIIPESYHILGIIVKSVCCMNYKVTNRMLLEISESVSYYVRTFKNNPSAAKHNLNL